MEWMKYTITTTEEACDLVCAMLNDLGITSLEIEDKAPVSPEENGGYFGDVVPDPVFDDHKARVTFYTEVPEIDSEEAAEREEELLRSVGQGLMDISRFADIGDGLIEIDKTAEEDWVNNWKQYFHQFTVDDIRIIPSWEEVPAEGNEELVLRIDPGTAFGTGKHESTQLAIRGIRKYVEPGMRVLDIGTGSGILGIVALKSGASKVFGTDLDINVLEAIEENLAKNGIDPADFRYVIGDIVTEQWVREEAGSGYDLVCANIIAEILADITPHVPACLKKGGYYITSGILITHAQIVRDAISKAGMTIVEEMEQGEWESIVARKDFA